MLGILFLIAIVFAVIKLRRNKKTSELQKQRELQHQLYMVKLHMQLHQLQGGSAPGGSPSPSDAMLHQPVIPNTPLYAANNPNPSLKTKKLLIIGSIIFFVAISLFVYKTFEIDFELIRALGIKDYWRMKHG
jgi:hypothetical protein